MIERSDCWGEGDLPARTRARLGHPIPVLFGIHPHSHKDRSYLRQLSTDYTKVCEQEGGHTSTSSAMT